MIIWSTPQHIYKPLDREFGFTLDLCADPENAKCANFYLRGESLMKPWEGWQGWAFLNPPYGRDIAQWVKKAALCGWPIVAMLPGRTNAPWWHDYVMLAMQIRFIRRKVSFVGSNGKKGVPSFGSVLALFARHQEAPVICTSWDWKESGELRAEGE